MDVNLHFSPVHFLTGRAAAAPTETSAEAPGWDRPFRAPESQRKRCRARDMCGLHRRTWEWEGRSVRCARGCADRRRTRWNRRAAPPVSNILRVRIRNHFGRDLFLCVLLEPIRNLNDLRQLEGSSPSLESISPQVDCPPYCRRPRPWARLRLGVAIWLGRDLRTRWR